MAGKLIFLATGWGAKYGGLNAFNQDLCIALSELLAGRYEVLCAALQASQEEIESEQRVRLISLNSGSDTFDSDSVRTLMALLGPAHRDVVWWIGHDVITGPSAIEAHELSQSGKTAIVHHMDYEAYESYKDKDGALTRSKIERQREILSKADLVFGVGPKLAKSGREKISSKTQSEVVELIPGLANIEGLPMPETFRAITFGRLEPATDRIKQTRLTVAAFAAARGPKLDHLGPDSSLTVIGLSASESDSERKELLRLAEESSHKAIQIHGWPYMHDRDSLFDNLRRQSVCMMLSLHEGFGLAGWEAVAAEVPLIISKNSGLYETIDKILGGMGTGCVTEVEIRGSMTADSYQPSDVETVAEALIGIKHRGEKAKSNARILKRFLKKFCTWRATAATFAMSCGLDVPESAADIVLSRWDPEVLIDALLHFEDMVDEAARRKSHFQRIWDKMKPPASFRKRLVLFGGIASALCDDHAAEQYASWLTEYPSAHLFICYESGPAALARAKRLGRDFLETDSGLSSDAEERMKMKEERVRALKDLIIQKTVEGGEHLADRITMIPLKEPVTSYIMIADEEVYITPLFERRSSDTLSFALAPKPPQFRLDVLNSIVHHLQMIEHTDEAQSLIEELKSCLSEGS